MKLNRIFMTLVLVIILASQFFLATNHASAAGQLTLVDDLRMWSDGSGQWPPRVGDKVVAHIKIQNTGGQALTLNNVGVQGRRNGGENWDIGWWPVTLQPGQVWALDPNNERPLQDGNYSFRISYQDGSGWHPIGNEINFSVNSSSNDNQDNDIPPNNQPENHPNGDNGATDTNTQPNENSGGNSTDGNVTSSSPDGSSAPNVTSGESTTNKIDQLDSVSVQLDAAGNSLDLIGVNPVVSATLNIAQAPIEVVRYTYSGDQKDLLKGSLDLGIGTLFVYAGLVAAGVVTAPVSVIYVTGTILVLGAVRYLILK